MVTKISPGLWTRNEYRSFPRIVPGSAKINLLAGREYFRVMAYICIQRRPSRLTYLYPDTIMIAPANPIFKLITIKELHPTFGAEIHGVDFSQPVEDAVFQEIMAAIAKVD